MLLFCGVVLLTSCRSTPDSSAVATRCSGVSILDGNLESRRYTLYIRNSDGSWFHGGGLAAFNGQAFQPMSVTNEDRQAIASAMDKAGWLGKGFEPTAGPGPRFLEISYSGGRRGTAKTRFRLDAVGEAFDPEVEELLEILEAVVKRGYDEVLDALPKGRRTDS